jgi:hypothetical protein
MGSTTLAIRPVASAVEHVQVHFTLHIVNACAVVCTHYARYALSVQRAFAAVVALAAAAVLCGHFAHVSTLLLLLQQQVQSL